MSFTTYFLQDAAGGPADLFSGLLPFVLIIAIFYFFIIRPQSKKQKETERMIKAIKKGDKVITIGGIHGVVSETKEATLIIKVDDGAKIEFNRSAIATVVVDKKADSKAKAKEEPKSEAAETKEETSSSEENK